MSWSAHTMSDLPGVVYRWIGSLEQKTGKWTNGLTVCPRQCDIEQLVLAFHVEWEGKG